MKRDEVVSLGKAEYEKFIAEVAAKKASSFWEPIVQKSLNPARRIRSQLRRAFWRMKMRVKKHYHLHLVLRDEEKHWRVAAIFQTQSRREKEPKQVTKIFETLPRRLRTLRKKMDNASPESSSNHRRYRGEFIKIVREHRGLSREQACSLLNSHRDLSVLARRHPSYWLEFPFTPAFIQKFEESTNTIFEEITQGFLFGAGFPTQEFARWLSEIYLAGEEFAEFKVWYEELEMIAQ
ncbi:MAG: hypothetical protein KF681_10990 [Bdellovibrionaceae bacterium]|nr:hypothetical protein [Pseudobdellovibrionaceae bacterium]MBX3040691.1 hypothetical protein [Pseudobdellovibrionaceae bacterium]